MTTDPNDTRPTAHRLTVTPETMRLAEALGFEPGGGDVLLWALKVAGECRTSINNAWLEGRAVADDHLGTLPQPARMPCPYPEGSHLAQWWSRGYASMARQLRAMDAERERDELSRDIAVVRADLATARDLDAEHFQRAVRAETERDDARRDLARIVELCGWDCDGNDPETPAGAIHLYGDAVQAVRELVEERAEDSREIVLLHRLCSEAADMLDSLDEPPTPTIGDAKDAIADRLRAASDEKPPRPICGAVVRERVTGTMTARTLCPLPLDHDGEHAEALAGNDTDTDRSTT